MGFSSVGRVHDLRTEGRWFEPPARPIFFPRIDDSHCDRIHSSPTAVHHFDDGYGREKPVAWKEYFEEYRLKEFQESMDRCTGRYDITEITLNTIQSISQSLAFRSVKT